MTYLYNLSEVSADMKNEVGGKNAMLGELMRVKPMISIPYAVPGGYAISATAFSEWLEAGGLKDDRLAATLKSIGKDVPRLEDLSQMVNEKMGAVAIPEQLAKDVKKALDTSVRYAVRSSGIGEDGGDVSFAGQHDSFLNTPTKEVEQRIRDVWLSAFHPRALYYRVVNGKFEEPIRQGVVIQEMVQPEIAGVSFSIDPATGSKKHGYVEYIKGLGEDLVSGKVTPEKFGFLRSEVAKEPDGRLRQISITTMELEHTFGWPVDLEWAWNKGLFLLQVRPQTAIPEALSEDQVDSIELMHETYGLPFLTGQSLARGTATVNGFISREQAKFTLSDKDTTHRWKLEKRVLLVPYTTPNDMPILERVAGVMVDKGGVTSHAAIVCRELNKPCMRIDSIKDVAEQYEFSKGVGLHDFAYQTGHLDTNKSGGRAAWYKVTKEK